MRTNNTAKDSIAMFMQCPKNLTVRRDLNLRSDGGDDDHHSARAYLIIAELKKNKGQGSPALRNIKKKCYYFCFKCFFLLLLQPFF
jgi:hypothetical protein